MAFTRRHFLASIAALPLLSLPAYANHGKDLHFLNCRNSVDKEALEAFHKETELKVLMDIYLDETQFTAEFLSGNPRYDIVLASDDNISHLRRTNLLSPLSRTLLPNIRQLEPHLTALDPEPKQLFFSLPYLWGTVGIAYRKSAISPSPESWKVLLDSDKYAGRIALLADKLTLFQITQKYLGYSVNSHDAEVIEEAQKALIKQKPNIKIFSNRTANLLRSGKVDLAMVWSQDFLKILQQTGDFGYSVPKEGSLIWQKSLCIPKHAGDPVAAHRFIDFLLEKKTAARLAKKFHYATPNKEAWELLGQSYTANIALVPPEDVFKSSEIRHFPQPEQNRLYKVAWNRIIGG